MSEKKNQKKIPKNKLKTNLIKKNTGSKSLGESLLILDLDSFSKCVKTFLLSRGQEFKVSLLNLNSANSKFHHIDFLLSQQLLDVLVINESRLTEDVDESFFVFPSYKLFRRGRGKGSGGGLLVYQH